MSKPKSKPITSTTRSSTKSKPKFRPKLKKKTTTTKPTTTTEPLKNCQTKTLPIPGSDYNGHVSTTYSGKTCQNWQFQYPHKHEYTGYYNHNYCRNPDNNGQEVWCYTTDKNQRWEYCSQIKDCDLPKTTKTNCQSMSKDGADYGGTLSQTHSGRTCQPWKDKKPHIPHYGQSYNHNFCRNPSGYKGGIWCYTTDPLVRWETCTQIKGKLNISKILLNFNSFGPTGDFSRIFDYLN